MEININDDNEFTLKKVFNPVILETKEKEVFSICMRDGGFEFNYNGVWYEAKENKVTRIGDHTDRMLKTCDNFVKRVLNKP